MVLDASKPDFHRDILTRELESVGIRLNRTPPNIYFKKKKTGGISFNAVVPLTHLDEKMCQRILQVDKALDLVSCEKICKTLQSMLLIVIFHFACSKGYRHVLIATTLVNNHLQQNIHRLTS